MQPGYPRDSSWTDSQSVAHLIEAIDAYINDHNSDPKPFVWTAKAKDIIEKVGRARAVLDKITSG